MKLLHNFIRRIQRTLSETAFVWIHEINTAFRDEAVLVFMIIVPLGYPLLYSYIYNNEVVREIPVAVVDNCRSSLSREYIRLLDASQYANVTQQAPDLESARELMRREKVYCVLHIPADFSRNLNTGRQTRVFAFCDARTLLYYRQFSLANTDVSLKMNARIKLAQAGNTTRRQDDITTAPLQYREVNLFNPTTGIASSILPAVLILILQQTMLLGVAINAGTMREKNTFRLFSPIAHHSGGMLQIVLGRSLCYMPVYIATSVYILGITPMLFHFNRLVHFADIVAFMLPYLLAISFLAQAVSHLVKTRESSMMMILFSSLVLLFISGISWPWCSIPPFWKVVSYLFPSTFGINGFVRMTNEGAHLSQVSFEYTGLWIQAFAYMLLAMYTTRKDISQSCRKFNRLHRKPKANRTESASIGA
jgi:ABC-2 type transport system permease protein